ncbi:hypothetical protein I4U23_002050 [Adineta vaga]|nr:hypothetical protein I4U23_002050 [Adineta vaga]
MSMKKDEDNKMQLRWPIEDIVSFAKRYALTHGLLCLVPDNLDQATIVPFSLFPSPYSYTHFKFIWSIQTAYNRLYNRLSLDNEVLEKALASVIPIDDFIGQLWKIHRTVQRRQPIQLDIYRNDYMLDTKSDKMRQVEFNTISSAFAGLTGIVADIHKAILRYAIENCHVRELQVNEEKTQSNSSIDLILPNEALNKSAEAMVKAFDLYKNPDACILFLIVPKERNVCDQNALIDAIQKLRPNIRFHLRTFEQLTDELEYDEKTSNIYLKTSHDEIAIVYFRAGYIPDHYINEKCWLVREQIEQSCAIKCPTIRSQLAGFKIVQEYLTHEGVLEKFIEEKDLITKIRSTFAAMFTFDDDKTREKHFEILRQNTHSYVLKPNREGGGNNKYDDEILKLLQNEKENPLTNYIAMEKILPPVCTACLIKPNDQHVLHVECINEIGIYGTMVTNVDTNEEYINEVTGYLVRTKTTDTNEGGVATGYSVLDCLDVSGNTNILAKIFSQKL